MPLSATLDDITARLRRNAFPNEQAISQGIVLQVLQALGWDTYDTETIWPEYQTGDGRADYAVCHPRSKPAAFIEVKQPGKAEDAVRQALEYAFHCGVPFVVLTDGRTWSFYLPAEQGDYEERRVYKIDLYERSSNEAAGAFRLYLSRDNVKSGKALAAARKEYRSRKRRSEARSAIPEVWRELVAKRDDNRLVDIVLDAVESKVGFRPNTEDVSAFLGNLAPAQDASAGQPRPGAAVRRQRRVSAPATEPASDRPKPEPRLPRPAPSTPHGSGKLVVFGKEHQCRSAKDAMTIVLTELAKSRPSLLEGCAARREARGRKRRYIARTPEDLYPHREDLRRWHAELPGGWLVATNLNTDAMRMLVRLATEEAGLTFGRDVVFEFHGKPRP